MNCQMMWLPRDDHAVILENRSIKFDSQITCYYPAIPSAPHQGPGLRKTAGVTLPYGNGSFRLAILVPLRDYFDTTATIDTLLEQFNWKTWQETTKLFRGRAEFDLGLPKFRFIVGHDLKNVLQALGIIEAFDPVRADFSNMFADSVGWFDRVEQKVFVMVDEKGTEAAAVTKLDWPDSIPPEIVADRPFLIVLYEAESGAILLIGKVSNPTWDIGT
jgi:serpin B